MNSINCDTTHPFFNVQCSVLLIVKATYLSNFADLPQPTPVLFDLFDLICVFFFLLQMLVVRFDHMFICEGIHLERGLGRLQVFWLVKVRLKHMKGSDYFHMLCNHWRRVYQSIVLGAAYCTVRM